MMIYLYARLKRKLQMLLKSFYIVLNLPLSPNILIFPPELPPCSSCPSFVILSQGANHGQQKRKEKRSKGLVCTGWPGAYSPSSHQLSVMIAVANTWPKSKWNLHLGVAWLIRKVNNLWLKYLQVVIGEKHSDELAVRILKIYLRKYSFWLSRIGKRPGLAGMPF